MAVVDSLTPDLLWPGWTSLEGVRAMTTPGDATPGYVDRSNGSAIPHDDGM
jgi:hypothetical protein